MAGTAISGDSASSLDPRRALDRRSPAGLARLCCERLAAVVMLVAAACGTVGDEPAVTGELAGDLTVAPFEAALGCEALADRWAALQQEYLDRLGTATADDLAEPSAAVASASQWLGNAMIEQTRDAAAAGCTELTSGSVALCTRINRLSAAGEAGEVALASLRGSCG